MPNLLPKVFIAGLGAAVSPVAVILLISVMLRGHAARNSLLFLAGFTLVLLAVGVAGMTLLGTAGNGKHDKTHAYIDLALAALCLALLPVAARRKPKPEEEIVDLNASGAFLRGMVTMLLNSSTMVIYISGVHEISGSAVSASGKVLALAALTVTTLLTLLIPITLYFISPRRAQELLGSARKWLSAHSKAIGLITLTVFAAYFLAKGIDKLV